MKFNKIFCIHRQNDIEREKYVSDLKIKLDYNEFIIVEPNAQIEDYSSYICMWSKKVPARKAVISLYNTNIKLLQKIAKEKLDNVLILEDDAVLKEKEMKELDKDAWIHFLNIRTWNNRNISCLANYYPKWENTDKLVNTLNKYKILKKCKHRPFDIELDYMKKKYDLDFKYSDYFYHPNVLKSTLGNESYNL